MCWEILCNINYSSGFLKLDLNFVKNLLHLAFARTPLSIFTTNLNFSVFLLDTLNATSELGWAVYSNQENGDEVFFSLSVAFG
jgi:hypothetical protein